MKKLSEQGLQPRTLRVKRSASACGSKEGFVSGHDFSRAKNLIEPVTPPSLVIFLPRVAGLAVFELVCLVAGAYVADEHAAAARTRGFDLLVVIQAPTEVLGKQSRWKLEESRHLRAFSRHLRKRDIEASRLEEAV